jgi:hypothetical protein
MNLAERESESKGWDELAANYYEAIISPFAQGVQFRLGTDIHHYLSKWNEDGTIERRVVMDFGCGCGPAMLLVAGQVGLAAGIDFSERMLDQSEKALKGAGISLTRYGRRKGIRELRHQIDLFEQAALPGPQTFLVNGDMRQLGPIHKRVDLGLAINSICPPNPQDVKIIFHKITECIKQDGFSIFLFPSLDTMHYLFTLIQRYQDQEKSPRRKKPPYLGRVEDGIYIEPEGDRQKYFEPDEIRALFDYEGWIIDEMEKVFYPWDLIQRIGWGHFPKEDPLWDWYVIAHAGKRKKSTK